MFPITSVGRRISIAFRRLSSVAIRDDPLPKESIVELSCEVYRPLKGDHIDRTKLPVLMLHGLFGSKLNYRSVGRKISHMTKLEVKGLDFRNHGSSPHALPLSYKALVADVVHHIERHEDVETIKLNGGLVLLGHSMGAKVAMLIALERPELVSKLIVVDNSPVKQDLHGFIGPGLEGMCEVERELQGSNSPNSVLWPKISLILSRYVKDERERFFLMSNLDVKGKVKPHRRRFRIPVLQFLHSKLALEVGEWPLHRSLRFSKPVLIMKAQHSDFIDDKGLQEFSAYFSDIDVETFDTNHWIVANEPDQFVRSVVGFIQK